MGNVGFARFKSEDIELVDIIVGGCMSTMTLSEFNDMIEKFKEIE